MFTLSNAFFPYIGAPGLSIAIDGGQVINNGSSTFVPAQTISLAANTTTYVFLNTSSITVQSNTSGFPSFNCYPIAIVVSTNASVTTITDVRPDVQGSGSGGGSGSSSSPGPGSKGYVVDGARTDTYISDGSDEFPFKTIMAAVNQVIANGDGATQAYVITIYPATYAETISLNSALLGTIQFISASPGGAKENAGGVNVTGSGGVGVSSTANNSSLLAIFQGIKFLSTVTATGTGVNPGIILMDCTTSAVSITSCTLNLWCVHSQSTYTLTSTTSTWKLCDLRGGVTMSGTSLVVSDACDIGGTIVLNDTAIFQFSAGSRSIGGTTFTVNTGTELDAWNANLRGTVTVNAGGLLSINDGWVQTIVLTGTLSVSGTGGMGNLILGVAAPTVQAGQVGLGSTTATTATAGANGAVPAQVAGYLIINVAGTAQKIPYFNT